MATKHLEILLWVLTGTLASCVKGGGGFLKQKEGSGVASLLTVQQVGEEKVAATISASATETQTLRVAAGSDIDGTEIQFPPGALIISSKITVQPGAEIATSSVAADLGLSEDTSVASASAPVVIKSQVSQDTQSPFTLRIPVAVTSLALADDNTPKELIAIYKVERVATSEVVLGIIPSKSIKLEGGYASFETNFFGAYQLAYVNKVIETAVSKPVSEKILTREEQKQIAPLQIVSWSAKVDPTQRAATVDITLSEDVPAFCVALLDSDGILPADRTIPLAALKGGQFGGISPKEHVAHAAIECKDKTGRTARTGFDRKVAFPAMTIESKLRFAEPYVKNAPTAVIGARIVGNGVREFTYAVVATVDKCAGATYGEWMSSDRETIIKLQTGSNDKFAVCFLGRDGFKNQLPLVYNDDALGTILGVNQKDDYGIFFDRLEDCLNYGGTVGCPIIKRGHNAWLSVGYNGPVAADTTMELYLVPGTATACSGGSQLPLALSGGSNSTFFRSDLTPTQTSAFSVGPKRLCARLLKAGKEILTRVSPGIVTIDDNPCADHYSATQARDLNGQKVVCNAQQLYSLSSSIGSGMTIVLGDDIEMGGFAPPRPTLMNVSLSSGSFVFDGNGYSIRGYSQIAATGTAGFFENLACSGTGTITIKNVALVDVIIDASTATQVGGLVNTVSCPNTTISNVSVQARTVTGSSKVGGFIGEIISGSTVTFNDVEFIGNVTGSSIVGGLVGENRSLNSKVNRFIGSGRLVALTSGAAGLGGLVGRIRNDAEAIGSPILLDFALRSDATVPAEFGLVVGSVLNIEALDPATYNSIFGSSIRAFRSFLPSGSSDCYSAASPSQSGCVLPSYANSSTFLSSALYGSAWVNSRLGQLPRLASFAFANRGPDEGGDLQLDPYFVGGAVVDQNELSQGFTVSGLCNPAAFNGSKFRIALRVNDGTNDNNREVFVNKAVVCPSSGNWETTITSTTIPEGEYFLNVYSPRLNYWRDVPFSVRSTCVSGGGTSSPANPNIICTQADFVGIGSSSGYFALGANIVLTGSVNTMRDSSWSSTPGFAAHLDGRGFAISGFRYLPTDSASYPSLLGRMASSYSATVHNLVLRNLLMEPATSSTAVGALFGEIQTNASTVERLKNVRVYGVIRSTATSAAVGGIAGNVMNSSSSVALFRNIRFNGKVSGATYTGGLFGLVDGQSGQNSVNIASFSGTVFSAAPSYPVGGAYGKIMGSAHLDNHYLNNVGISSLNDSMAVGALAGSLYGSGSLSLTFAHSVMRDIRLPYGTGPSYFLAGAVSGSSGSIINYASSIVDESRALPSPLSGITVAKPSDTSPPPYVWDPTVWVFDPCTQCSPNFPRLR